MTRRIIIAGNWKMNTRADSAAELAKGVVQAVEATSGDVEVAVCPPLVYLSTVADAVAGSPVELGAQNLYASADGAFTGEVNASMLTDVGCRFVILGHSERRQLMGETDAGVAEKLHAALAGNLVPIVCVGETLEEREAGTTEAVVGQQVKGSLEGLDEARAAGIVIAYEPVWAIGTGKTASKEQAEEVHAFIRNLLGEMFSPDVAEQVRIQYGGSVKPGNAVELLAQPNIDGALVGGASLKAADFVAIIEAAPAMSAET
ncbi:MAG: triose-phosphate isomerase [Planctomycetota bacterium]